jgi:type II secretory pathway pseudopilin PulG
MKYKNKGVTLIEILAVIIISVLLIIGAFALYDKTVNKNKESDLISGIHSIQMSIKNSVGDSLPALSGEASCFIAVARMS